MKDLLRIHLDFAALGRAIVEFAFLEVHTHAVLHDWWDLEPRAAAEKTAKWSFSAVLDQLLAEARADSQLDACFQELVDELRELSFDRNRIAHTSLVANGDVGTVIAYRSRDGSAGIDIVRPSDIDAEVRRFREKLNDAHLHLVDASERLITAKSQRPGSPGGLTGLPGRE